MAKARELMQLFTIGLWEMEVDGTYKINEDTGGLIQTYTSANVRDFAKVWTGFEHQPPRSNMERRGDDKRAKNMIDPMRLLPLRRDRFPKTLLSGGGGAQLQGKLKGGYLGDTYPLCSDLPPRHFLRKGAKYRYHGTTSMYGPEMEWTIKEGKEPTRAHFEPNEQHSQLHAALCSNRGNRCTFPPVVVLEEDLDCHSDSECHAEMIHAVKIVDASNSVTGFYTYVAPPCVRLQFFEGQVAAYENANACTDPQVASTVGTQCCHKLDHASVCPAEYPRYESHTGQTTHGDLCRDMHGNWDCPAGCTVVYSSPYCTLNRPEQPVTTNSSTSEEPPAEPCHLDLGGIVSFSKGECLHLADTTKYATAQDRCAALYDDGIVCPREEVNVETSYDDTSRDSIWQTSCSKYQFSWVNEPCRLEVQVYPSGLVGVVDTKSSYHVGYMRIDSGNTFQAHWENTEEGNGDEAGGRVGDDSTTLFPVYSDGCGEGCVPIDSHSGSCLCEAVVVDTAVFVDDNNDGVLPAEAVLRAELLIGAFPPDMYDGAYTLCTTPFCKSRPGIQVYVRGTSNNPTAFGADTIFEFAEQFSDATRPKLQQRPSPQKPAKYLMNRRSVVHVGNPKHEFVLLEPTHIAVAGCSASSQFGTGDDYACDNAFKDGGEFYSNGTTMAGTWLFADFGVSAKLLEAIDIELATNVVERPSQILFEFSDGTSYSTVLQNTDKFNKIMLPNTVETLHVNMTIESVHEAPCVFPFVYDNVTFTECTAFKHDRYWCATKVDENGDEAEWRNCVQGVQEIRFLPPGAADRLSSTPCQDAGLLPVTKDECEKSARHVVPDGYTVTVDRWHGRLDIEYNSRWNPGCSVWAGLQTAESDGRYDGWWTPYWNARTEVFNWNSNMWPVCKRPLSLSSSPSNHGYRFRNPPHFMANTAETTWMPGMHGDMDTTIMPFGDGDHLLAFAEHETNALIDHIVEHGNTAPFIAKRLIQRLVTSNPSPRYVKAVATAFKKGTYGSPSQRTYSGNFGDMAATFSAIFLDDEARSSVLDFDPTHGQLREPLLKVMHLLRAMEFKSEHNRDIELSFLENKIGQMAFASPSVFSYFLPEFAPNGPVQTKGLVAPEAQIATAPYLIGYLNGVNGIIERGLSGCSSVDHNGAFGAHRSWGDCSDVESIAEASEGRLHFKPEFPSNPRKAVDELATLLTGGRMSDRTHSILLHTYSQFLSETPYNMSAALTKTMAATFAEAECLAAIKDYVNVPVHLLVQSCTASSVASASTTCDRAHDGEYLEHWQHWEAGQSKGAGAWIAFTFADTLSVVGRIALAGCNSHHHRLAQPKSILLQFSNGEEAHVEVTQKSLCDDDRAFIELDVPVETASVNLTFETVHEPLKCVFPFMYNGIIYDSCTDVAHSQHWCAIKVDSETLAELDWGNCAFENSTSIAVEMALTEVQFYSPGSVPINIMSNEEYHTGSWTSIPPGCSKKMHPYNHAYFNHDPVGCGAASCNGYDLMVRDRDDLLWVTASEGILAPWAAVDGKVGDSTNCISSPDSNGVESPWLEIYFGKQVLDITSISLHHQHTSGSEQNDGLSVYVGDTRCASNVGPFQKLGKVSRIPCIAKGNTVRIVNQGTAKMIKFCEMHINVALQPNGEGAFPSNKRAEAVALKRSLKVLALSAPEWHATNVNAVSTKERGPPRAQPSLNRKFKAVVVVFFSGGADSFNMVVPHSECTRKANASKKKKKKSLISTVTARSPECRLITTRNMQKSGATIRTITWRCAKKNCFQLRRASTAGSLARFLDCIPI